MVKQEPVSVGWQTIFMIIPVVNFWAFYRIEKLRLGLVIVLAIEIPSFLFQMLLPFPYGLGVSIGMLVISIVIPMYFVRKWSREWNERISSGVQKDEKTTSPKSPLLLLQERYAKGEITKEEFDKMKEDLA